MDQIETKRLLLRKLLASDAERIEKLAGDYDVAKTTLNIPHPYPAGSWRVMEKAGLTYEGTLRQHVARLGEFHDLVYYGLLKEEYEKGFAQKEASDDLTS